MSIYCNKGNEHNLIWIGDTFNGYYKCKNCNRTLKQNEELKNERSRYI